RSPTGELLDSWSGCSFPFDYKWTDDEKVAHTFSLRLLATESTALRDLKVVTYEKRRATERARLDRATAALSKKEFESAIKARKAATEAIGQPLFHKVEVVLSEEFKPAKRARRGRPRNDEPQTLELVHRATLRIEFDEAILTATTEKESCFVLATSLPSEGTGAKTDPEIFRLYRE